MAGYALEHNSSGIHSTKFRLWCHIAYLGLYRWMCRHGVCCIESFAWGPELLNSHTQSHSKWFIASHLWQRSSLLKQFANLVIVSNLLACLWLFLHCQNNFELSKQYKQNLLMIVSNLLTFQIIFFTLSKQFWATKKCKQKIARTAIILKILAKRSHWSSLHLCWRVRQFLVLGPDEDARWSHSHSWSTNPYHDCQVSWMGGFLSASTSPATISALARPPVCFHVQCTYY